MKRTIGCSGRRDRTGYRVHCEIPMVIADGGNPLVGRFRRPTRRGGQATRPCHRQSQTGASSSRPNRAMAFREPSPIESSRRIELLPNPSSPERSDMSLPSLLSAAPVRWPRWPSARLPPPAGRLRPGSPGWNALRRQRRRRGRARHRDPPGPDRRHCRPGHRQRDGRDRCPRPRGCAWLRRHPFPRRWIAGRRPPRGIVDPPGHHHHHRRAGRRVPGDRAPTRRSPISSPRSTGSHPASTWHPWWDWARCGVRWWATPTGRPTADELATMTAMVEQALAQGACGASSGLEYTPGAFASRDELIALCRPLAARGWSTPPTCGTKTTGCSRPSRSRLRWQGAPAAGCRSLTSRPRVPATGPGSTGPST